jgi:hypothetical protein
VTARAGNLSTPVDDVGNVLRSMCWLLGSVLAGDLSVGDTLRIMC